MTRATRTVAGVAVRLAIVMVAGTAMATIASLGARASWILELFSHFPVQYLALQVPAGVACLWLGRRRWAAVALVAALPNALVVAPYLPGFTGSSAVAHAAPSASASGDIVRLVAANLLYLRDDPTATLPYLASGAADILVLSEFTPRWHHELKELEHDYPHFAVRPRTNPWGMAVYSRYPILEAEDLDLGDERSSNLRVLVRTPAGPLEVYAVHLASPPREDRAAMRNLQLRHLAQRIAMAGPVPRIVAGDFNLTPYSPYFRDLLRDGGLQDARRPSGLTATWPAWPVPIWIPIDHCLVAGPLTVVRVATGPDIGSDHYPIECAIELDPTMNGQQA